MGVCGVGQITLTDLTDFELTLTPSTFFIPTSTSLLTSSTGSQDVVVSLKEETTTLTGFTIDITDSDIPTGLKEVSTSGATLTFNWLSGKTISEQYIYSFNIVYNNITIPANVVIVANKKGATGATGAYEVSRINYYCVAAKTDAEPSAPTTYSEESAPTGWSITEQVPSNEQFSYVVTYIKLSDGTGYYTNVTKQEIISSLIEDTTDLQTQTDQLNTNMESRFEQQTAITDTIQDILAGKGDSSIYNELYSVITKQYIIEDASLIADLAEKIYLQAKSKDSSSSWSTLVSLDENGFTGWATDNSGITTSMNLSADGLRLNSNDVTKSKYSVLVTNEGILIQRADTDSTGYEDISRFRRQQLTVQDVRVSSPQTDTANRTSMKIASDGGIIFVVDTAITE